MVIFNILFLAIVFGAYGFLAYSWWKSGLTNMWFFSVMSVMVTSRSFLQLLDAGEFWDQKAMAVFHMAVIGTTLCLLYHYYSEHSKVMSGDSGKRSSLQIRDAWPFKQRR